MQALKKMDQSMNDGMQMCVLGFIWKLSKELEEDSLNNIDRTNLRHKKTTK